MCQGLVHCSGEVKKMTDRRLKGDPKLTAQSICVFKDGVLLVNKMFGSFLDSPLIITKAPVKC